MSRLKEIADRIGEQKQPPVHLWNPDVIGEVDIRIDFQGEWFHEGTPITREPLKRLFASILWHEAGRYYLVTPVEKLQIQVDDSPFVIHQMERLDGAWVAVTNTHESLIIGLEHQVELRNFRSQWLPYVNVRYDLWARVNRSIYYQWVEEAMESWTEGSPLVLTSRDYVFEVARDQ